MEEWGSWQPTIAEWLFGRRRELHRLAFAVYRIGPHHRRTLIHRHILKPGANHMATVSLVVGQVGDETDTMTIEFLDQNGNQMVTTPTPDVPPVWTNAPSPAGADSFAVAVGGLSATLSALAAGSDTVNLTVTVGGVVFTATQPFSIAIPAPPPQVLTAIAIVNTLS